jgi:hypothetical protein
MWSTYRYENWVQLLYDIDLPVDEETEIHPSKPLDKFRMGGYTFYMTDLYTWLPR